MASLQLHFALQPVVSFSVVQRKIVKALQPSKKYFCLHQPVLWLLWCPISFLPNAQSALTTRHFFLNQQFKASDWYSLQLLLPTLLTTSFRYLSGHQRVQPERLNKCRSRQWTFPELLYLLQVSQPVKCNGKGQTLCHVFNLLHIFKTWVKTTHGYAI